MTKRMFFSYLLSLNICFFSLQAMEPQQIKREALDVKQEFDNVAVTVAGFDLGNQELISELVTELPLLAECVVDEDNNVLEIINIKRLNDQEIRRLYNLLDQTDEDMSLQRGLRLLMTGSVELLQGVGIVAFVGGKFFFPYAQDFTYKTIDLSKIVYANLSEMYADYMAKNNQNLEAENLGEVAEEAQEDEEN